MSHAEVASYRASGRVRWGKLLGWILPVLAVAGLVAWLLDRAFEGGWYYMLMTPLVLALPVYGVVALALRNGHCRSRPVAVVLGGIAPLVMFLGQYYVGMVSLFGMQNAHRLDLVPPYIEFRMMFQQVQALGPGANDNGQFRLPAEADIARNWVWFGLEALIVMAAGIALAWSVASRPYCERCGRGTRTRMAMLPAGSGPQVVELFHTGRLHEMASVQRLSLTALNRSCRLTLESCPSGEAADAPCPAYLSVQDAPVKWSWLVKAPTPKRLLNRAVIGAEDIAALAVVWPGLPLGRRLSAADALSARKTSTVAEQHAAPLLRALAHVTQVPEPERGHILSKRHLVIGTLIAFSPFIVAAAGFALFAYAVTGGDRPSSTAAIVALVLGGIGCIGFCLFVALYYSDFLPSRYLYGVTKREIDGRGDRWVDPHDPEAIYVQIVPRENWTRVMLENASDVGFLVIDESRRELRFEGDQERFRVPAAAIESCTIEEFTLPIDTTGYDRYYMSVLRAWTPAGLWETLFAHRHITLERQGSTGRRRLADELTDRILALAERSR